MVAARPWCTHGGFADRAKLKACLKTASLLALPSLEDNCPMVVLEAMAPWAAGHMYLNFAESDRRPASFWSEHAYHRLRRVKAAVDPENRIRANHPIEPA